MEWLTDNFWLAWLGIAIVLAAIEAATVDFVFIMFAGGALAGAVAALGLALSADQGRAAPDDYVQVDPQCKAMFSFSQTSSRPLTTLQVDARGFTLEGQHYLALSEADVARLLAQGMSIDGQPPREPEDHTPTEAVTLLRYRIEEDVFSYAMIDYAMVEKLVKEKSLDADALDQVSINLKGDDEHLLGILRQYPELFKQDPKMTMTLRRAPVEAGP